MIPDDDIASRLTDLETRLAFQENAIHELNDVVHRQQHEIERLTRSVMLLAEQLRSALPSLVAPAEHEEPPPHY